MPSQILPLDKALEESVGGGGDTGGAATAGGWPGNIIGSGGLKIGKDSGESTGGGGPGTGTTGSDADDRTMD